MTVPWLEKLIRDTAKNKVNNLKEKQVEMIENTLRDSVFHSTLDWQTRPQLKNGIRRAIDTLKETGEL